MILIGRHRTEMEKFFIFTPASSHRALRVSQSTPASVILQHPRRSVSLFRLCRGFTPPRAKHAAGSLLGGPAARPWPGLYIHHLEFDNTPLPPALPFSQEKLYKCFGSKN